MAVSEIGKRAAGLRRYEHRQSAKAVKSQRRYGLLKAISGKKAPIIKFDIGWVIFIAGLAFGFMWIIQQYLITKQIPSLGAFVSLLLFILIPLLVYHFITGGSLVEAVIAVVILFAFMMYGDKIVPQFFSLFSAFTTGQTLKFAMMSMLGM